MFGVAHRPGQVVRVANERIKAFFLPKDSAAAEQLVRLARTAPLPLVKQFAEGCLPDIDNEVNVVGHDYPGLKAVSLAILCAQDVLDLVSCLRPAQPAFAVTAIQPGLELAAAKGLVRFLQDGFPFPAAPDRERVG